MDKNIFAGAFLAVLAIIIGSGIFFFFKRHKKKQKTVELEVEEVVDLNVNTNEVIEKCNTNTVKAIISTSKAYFLCFEGFFNNDKQQLKNAIFEAEDFDKMAKRQKDDIFTILQKLQHDQIETGHFYVQVIDYLREMAHSLNFTVKPVMDYSDNKHKSLEGEQIVEFNEFRVELNNFFNFALYILKEKKFEDLDELILKRNQLVASLKELEKSQIKRIKSNSISTSNSILYFNIISETKSLLLNLINVVKAQRDFIRMTKLSIE